MVYQLVKSMVKEHTLSKEEQWTKQRRPWKIDNNFRWPMRIWMIGHNFGGGNNIINGSKSDWEKRYLLKWLRTE